MKLQQGKCIYTAIYIAHFTKNICVDADTVQAHLYGHTCTQRTASRLHQLLAHRSSISEDQSGYWIDSQALAPEVTRVGHYR